MARRDGEVSPTTLALVLVGALSNINEYSTESLLHSYHFLTLQPMKIAVLTSGGDSPGMNAVVRAVVKTGILRCISLSLDIQPPYK